MRTSRVLALGTHNRKKCAEMLDLLQPFGFTLVSLADLPQAMVVEETGTTFAENAALKACEQARHLGCWVMAEDSGIAIDALDGRPGVYSARYAGPDATDEDNNRKLLEELGNRPLEKRSAHYVCHVAVSDPTGNLRASSEARCYGRIRDQPSGTNGFGYDPLFEIPEYHRTFGELGESVKAVLSHRSRALALILPALRQLPYDSAWPDPRRAGG